MRGLECRQVCTCCHALIENEAFHFCASAEKSRFRLLDTRPLLQNKLSCAQKEARHTRKEAHDSVVSASAWRFGAVERCARDRACASPTRRHPCCRWCARGSAWSPRCAGRTRGALCPRAVASHGTWIRTSRRQAARDRVSGVAPAHGQARRACLLAGHQTARAGARKGRGRDPRPRRRLGSVGLDVKASLGRAGVCDWPAHRARALSALGLCGQGRTRKSAFCGEGTSASLADGGGRTGTWTAWSSSRIPSSSRRKNTSARWPCAMSSVSIRSEPHARADARRRPARAKDRVVQACEFHTTQALRSADSC